MPKKKVLIVSYYWPPAGGPGVQRWLKFVKYLPEEGVDPVLFVPQKVRYPLIDPTLCGEIPPGIRVYGASFFDPAAFVEFLTGKKPEKAGGIPSRGKRSSLSRITTWVRANFFIPDAKAGWIRPSVKKILRILKEENIDTLITTGPPHSCHVIGLKVKQKTGVRWIADFRDPWTKIDFFHHLPLTRCTLKRHQRLETEVLQEADQVVCVTPSMSADIAPRVKGTVHTITNGYDPDDFAADPEPLTEKFTIGHFGTMNPDRNPDELWEALEELCREDAGLARDLEIVLVGALAPEVIRSLESRGLKEKTVFYEYLPHRKALQLERSLRLLLLMMYRTPYGNLLIVGKTFEYLASGRPVLGIGYPEGDVARILEESQAGKMFGFGDKNEIKKFIRRRYDAYKQGSAEWTDSSKIEIYSRKNLTRRLVDEVIGKPPSTGSGNSKL